MNKENKAIDYIYNIADDLPKDLLTYQNRLKVFENTIKKLHQENQKLKAIIKEARKKLKEYSCIFNKGFPYDKVLVLKGEYHSEDQYLPLEKIINDFKAILDNDTNHHE